MISIRSTHTESITGIMLTRTSRLTMTGTTSISETSSMLCITGILGIPGRTRTFKACAFESFILQQKKKTASVSAFPQIA